MSDNNNTQSRRDLLKLASLAGAAGLFAPGLAAIAMEAGKSEKPLKAAFSNAGLQATWCAQGKQAAEYWGKLFNVEVTWFDGQPWTGAALYDPKTERLRRRADL